MLAALAFAVVAFGRRRSSYARVALGFALASTVVAAVYPTNDTVVRVSIVATFAAAFVLLVVAYRQSA